MSPTLDLNNPQDALDYIKSWIDMDALRIGLGGEAVLFQAGTDADYLRVAKQLFLHCDPRKPAGGMDH